LRMTSWNLFAIYTGLNPDLREILRPEPRVQTTSDWSESFTVRSPSFEWYTITTTGQAAGVRATDQSRGELPSHMQMFVVRIR
ncbi:MAG: hypothetical protein KY453_06355, partial [Gemmatimonadetes bacterium]|nr:hypothetical protein [Gemmatimonadota bacterium]